MVNFFCLAEQEGLRQCTASKEHSAAPSNPDESRPASEEAHEEAHVAHDQW